MRKIYVDLGTYDGDTIRAFMLGEMGVDPAGYEIYAWEPNPRYFDNVSRVASRYGATLITSAAWVSNGTIEMAMDYGTGVGGGLGSSVMQDKAIWKTGQISSVPCIDFSEWLEQFRGDYVVVKMDIEGAEFPVLEHLIKTGNISIINKLFVEFHANKVPSYTSQDRENLKERVRMFTELNNWH